MRDQTWLSAVWASRRSCLPGRTGGWWYFHTRGSPPKAPQPQVEIHQGNTYRFQREKVSQWYKGWHTVLGCLTLPYKMLTTSNLVSDVRKSLCLSEAERGKLVETKGQTYTGKSGSPSGGKIEEEIVDRLAGRGGSGGFWKMKFLVLSLFRTSCSCIIWPGSRFRLLGISFCSGEKISHN